MKTTAAIARPVPFTYDAKGKIVLRTLTAAERKTIRDSIREILGAEPVEARTVSPRARRKAASLRAQLGRVGQLVAELSTGQHGALDDRARYNFSEALRLIQDAQSHLGDGGGYSDT